MTLAVEEIQRYTPVFAFPSLVVNEKLVCVGRFPSRAEVLAWIREMDESRIGG
jgi:hypothetical protein